MKLPEHNPVQTIDSEYNNKLNIKFLLQDMYRIVMKTRRRIIFFLFLCGIVGMLISLATYKIEYIASSDIRISVKIPDTLSANNQNNYFLDINKALAGSSVVLPMIQSDLFLDDLKKQLNVDSIGAEINMTSIGSSNIFNIQVTSNDASYAMKVLKKSIDVFGNIGSYIIDTFEITDITSPEVSNNAWNPMDLILKIIMMMLFGTSLVVCYIAYYAFARKTIHNGSEIKNALHQEYMGRIPYIHTITQLQKKGHFNIDILLNETIYRNTFQKIASRIEDSLDTKKSQVILVTSANYKEGVTNTSIGLGVGFALNGKNCVVIDGNFENPSMYKLLNVESFIDCNTYLNGNIKIEELPIKSDLENLSFIFSKEKSEKGNILPASQKMKELIRSLKKKYDYVIIDSDSMIYHADAEAYVQESDFTCMLIRPVVSKAISIMDSINALNRCSYSNQKIGCILNCADKNSVY